MCVCTSFPWTIRKMTGFYCLADCLFLRFFFSPCKLQNTYIFVHTTTRSHKRVRMRKIVKTMCVHTLRVKYEIRTPTATTTTETRIWLCLCMSDWLTDWIKFTVWSDIYLQGQPIVRKYRQAKWIYGCRHSWYPHRRVSVFQTYFVAERAHKNPNEFRSVAIDACAAMRCLLLCFGGCGDTV